MRIGYNGDWDDAHALLAGADAWYSIVAALLPQAALRLTRVCQTGDDIAAHEANAAFEPLWVLFREHSSLRVMYAIAEQLGFRPGKKPQPIQALRWSQPHRFTRPSSSLPETSERSRLAPFADERRRPITDIRGQSWSAAWDR